MTEWGLAPPHLFRNIIPPSQLIGKAIPECAEDETINSAECLCCEEPDLDIWVVWLHQTSRLHLDPLEINGLCTDGLARLDRVTCAMFTVGCGQMQQITTKQGEQRPAGKIGTKTSTGENDSVVQCVNEQVAGKPFDAKTLLS